MWREYELYKLNGKYDDFGNMLKNEYDFIEVIDVAVAVKTMSIIENEKVYQKNVLVGTTPYNSLVHGEQYKLTRGNKQYIIDSFVQGRICSLQLTEVL